MAAHSQSAIPELQFRMLITLTTDFGISSPYVAAMKGSLLSVCRDVELVDLTHAITPQNIRQAAVVLADVTPFFPVGTLHVVVVDPGVGTERNMIYAEIGDQHYLAPDNGVLSYVARQNRPRRLVALTEPRFWREQVSHTFHGRDIFAPVAGHLALGVQPDLFGPTAEAMVELPWSEPVIGKQEICGEVLYVDSFGNVITNIPVAAIQQFAGQGAIVISLAGRSIEGLYATYGQAPAGTIISLGDSQGRLEIAEVQGNAARLLGVTPGVPVRVGRKIIT